MIKYIVMDEIHVSCSQCASLPDSVRTPVISPALSGKMCPKSRLKVII